METDILTQCSGRSAALHLRSHSSLCSLRCALLSNLSHWSEYSISYAGVLSTQQHNDSTSPLLLDTSNDSGNPTSVETFTMGEDSDSDQHFKKRPYPPQMQTSSPLELHLIALIEALSNLNITSLPKQRKKTQRIHVQGGSSAGGSAQPPRRSARLRAQRSSGKGQDGRNDPPNKVQHIHIHEGKSCPALGCNGGICRCADCCSVPKTAQVELDVAEEALLTLREVLSICSSNVINIQKIFQISGGGYVLVTEGGVYVVNTSDNESTLPDNRIPIENIQGGVPRCRHIEQSTSYPDNRCGRASSSTKQAASDCLE